MNNCWTKCTQILFKSNQIQLSLIMNLVLYKKILQKVALTIYTNKKNMEFNLNKQILQIIQSEIISMNKKKSIINIFSINKSSKNKNKTHNKSRER